MIIAVKNEILQIVGEKCKKKILHFLDLLFLECDLVVYLTIQVKMRLAKMTCLMGQKLLKESMQGFFIRSTKVIC